MNVGLGILLALLAGTMNGIFALPMKLMKNWAWENVWLPFSFLSLLVFPLVIMILSVPDFSCFLASLSTRDIFTALLWGIFAYTGSLLFGISLSYIGIALAYTLLVGSMSIVGVFFPILIFNFQIFSTTSGILILIGILFFLISLFFSFKAGRIKEKSSGITNQGKGKRWMVKGMLLAIAGGTLSGLLSLGMSMEWAKAIIAKAVQLGEANPSYAGNAALGIVLIGGILTNAGYCLYLLAKNKSWHLYKENKNYWFGILVMGILYSGSVGLWGISISEKMLGALGPSVGWAMFIGMIVISSNVVGYLTGEWEGADKKAVRFNNIGMGWIILALIMIGLGNYML